jgi:hypothetical protein
VSGEAPQPTVIPIYRRGSDWLIRYVLPAGVLAMVLGGLALGDWIWAAVYLAVGALVWVLIVMVPLLGGFTALAELDRRGDVLTGRTWSLYGAGKPVEFPVGEARQWRYWGDNTVVRLLTPGYQPAHAYFAFRAADREWRLNFGGGESINRAELMRLTPGGMEQLERKFPSLGGLPL